MRSAVKRVINERAAAPLALTGAEAAELAGVSSRTIYRGIDAGRIPTLRFTPKGRIFVPRKALERFLTGV